MDYDFVTLKDLAQELGKDRSNLRKYILSHGFTFLPVRTPESRGQMTLALTLEDAESIREIRAREGFVPGTASIITDNGQGWFYVIQIVPDLAPNRVKLGFSGNVDARLQAHRASAPTAYLVRMWPCKRTWERAVMDSATRTGCKLIANEVFECDDIDNLVARCGDFFSLMPDIALFDQVTYPLNRGKNA